MWKNVSIHGVSLKINEGEKEDTFPVFQRSMSNFGFFIHFTLKLYNEITCQP